MLTINAIRAFAKDEVLLDHVLSQRQGTRIKLLRTLLHERSNINPSDIKALCDELGKLNEARNKAAHNPILGTTPDGTGEEYIHVIRPKRKGETKPEEIHIDQLNAWVSNSTAAIMRFVELVPEATSDRGRA